MMGKAGLQDIGNQVPGFKRKRGPTVMLKGSAGVPELGKTNPAKVAREPVFTVCPHAAYDPRIQCAPGEQPFGAGFAAVGIGRDIDTGSAWGERAGYRA